MSSTLAECTNYRLSPIGIELMLALRILYEDDHVVAIDKPCGFHSHPPEDKNVRLNPRRDALGILQKQTGLKLYPAHRLDRATSGILLFSKLRAQNVFLQEQFRMRGVEKTYFCIARGSLVGSAKIDQKLKTESGNEDAITLAEEIFSFGLPILGRDGEKRSFTLAKAKPLTGRYHQIRRHFAQLGLPILGDSRHGDKKLNREFATLTKVSHMLLRCMELKLQHPATGKVLHLKNRWTRDWHALFEKIGFCPIL